MLKAIDKYVSENITPSSNDDSLKQPNIHKFCLVNIDGNYHRAKVLDVKYNEEISMEVLLIDSGAIETVDMEKVFDISDDLIQRFPFQVIRTIPIERMFAFFLFQNER